jgi:hypothetical protein
MTERRIIAVPVVDWDGNGVRLEGFTAYFDSRDTTIAMEPWLFLGVPPVDYRTQLGEVGYWRWGSAPSAHIYWSAKPFTGYGTFNGYGNGPVLSRVNSAGITQWSRDNGKTFEMGNPFLEPAAQAAPSAATGSWDPVPAIQQPAEVKPNLTDAQWQDWANKVNAQGDASQEKTGDAGGLGLVLLAGAAALLLGGAKLFR